MNCQKTIFSWIMQNYEQSKFICQRYVTDAFFTKQDYRSLVIDRIMGDFSRHLWGVPFEFSYRYMAEALIRQLFFVKVRDDGGNWLVDLSEYVSVKHMI